MVRLSLAGSLAALQNMQPPRSRSGSLLGVPEADTPARSPSPFSSVIVRRSGTAGSDSSVVSSRQSPTPSVSPEPSPVSPQACVYFVYTCMCVRVFTYAWKNQLPLTCAHVS